jgi:predicted GNAT family acetyltransferase
MSVPSGYKVMHNVTAHRFEVDLGDQQAVLIYMIKAGLFISLHTEVPAAFEGRGIAAALTKAALNFAMQEGFKVRSYCSYTTRYLEKHPEFNNLTG